MTEIAYDPCRQCCRFFPTWLSLRFCSPCMRNGPFHCSPAMSLCRAGLRRVFSCPHRICTESETRKGALPAFRLGAGCFFFLVSSRPWTQTDAAASRVHQLAIGMLVEEPDLFRTL